MFQTKQTNSKISIKFNEFPQKVELFLFKFHDYFNGLIGYETLNQLRANINIIDKSLDLPNSKIQFQSIDNNEKSIDPFSKITTLIPVNIENGDFFCPPIIIKYGLQIQEGIYTTIKPFQARMEIINLTNKVINFSIKNQVNVKSLNENFTVETNHIYTSQQSYNSKYHTISNIIETDHLNDEERHKLLKLCKKFEHIFYKEGDNLSFSNNIKHEINLNNDKPIFIKQYRLPQIHKNIIKNEITQLLEQGIIRPSYSPWSSPIWLVPKKGNSNNNKKWRLVVDYRQLNKQTIDDKYPLPNITDILDKLGKSMYFTNIDLASGFHQIEIKSTDINKTGFSTEGGHFEFVRMPFGLKNAPSTFQRVMDNILGELQGKNVLCYLDDIVIYSTSLQEHIEDLHKVFTKLSNANLKIQTTKSNFLKTELEFLGHIVTKEGVKPNPNKIEAIMKFSIPKTQKQIKSFLGLVGYYRKFIKDFAKITKPLTNCLRKNEKIIHTDEFIKCFDKCKKLLTEDPILQYPDFSKQFILTTDASNYALGAVLSQGKHDLPVCYASRTLSKSEINYSTIEKELLGIVWSIKYFRPYLYGQKFIIRTDHKPLVWLFNCKEPNSKIIRWRLKLEEYNYEIQYKKGSANANADALSRLYNEEINEINKLLEYDGLSYPKTIDSYKNKNIQIQQKECENDGLSFHNSKVENNSLVTAELSEVLNNLNNIIIDENNDNHLRNKNVIPITKAILNKFKTQLIIEINDAYEQLKETFFIKYQQFKRFILKKKFFTDNDLIEILNRYVNKKHFTSIFCPTEIHNRLIEICKNNYQFSNLKVVRSTKICEDINNLAKEMELIIDTHRNSNHRGINENYKKLKRKYFFPKMKEKIIKYINSCELCQLIKYDRQPTQIKFEISETPTQPMQIVHCDVYSLRSRNYLTIIDKFSKFATVHNIPDRKSSTIITKFKKYFSNHGLPQKLIVDNASEFTSELFRSFLKMYNIQLHITTAKSSTGNSPIERFHSTLTEICKIIYQQNKKLSVHEVINEAVLTYNNSIHSAIDMTPFELYKGHINTNDPLKINTDNIQPIEYLEQHRKNYEIIKSLVLNKNKTEKEKIIQKRNTTRVTPPSLSTNDTIYELSTTRDKLTPKYIKHTVKQDHGINITTNKRKVHKQRIKNISK